MITNIFKHIFRSIKSIFNNDILNILTQYEENKAVIQKYIYLSILLILISFKVFLFDYFMQIIYIIYTICNITINIFLFYITFFTCVYLFFNSNKLDIREA